MIALPQNGLSAEPVVAPDPGCKMISLDKLNEWILYGKLNPSFIFGYQCLGNVYFLVFD